MSARPIAALALLVPAAAWAQPAGFAGHDTSAPIEITADRLEVRQRENVATFTGDVDAVQGDLTLSARSLDVFYGEEGAGDDTDADAGGAGLGEIRRAVARGDVVVSSPREIARGSEGVYDVAAGRITLTGDVVLTRDDNVLRGNRLAIDLASGVSRLQAAGEDGRVRARFAPTEPAR
ncbi:MAG: lipopolysaccharide transport periplasmic protein LptA [Alphaproteobacteria bacterium]|nr:lipopolysaccharide transport periplasmic protein LptA [Alphaproteobacteria bacterium]